MQDSGADASNNGNGAVAEYTEATSTVIGTRGDFDRKFVVRNLKLGTKEPSFDSHEVWLDPMRDTAGSLKEKMSIRAMVTHNSRIVEDDELLKNFFEEGSTPIVLVECPTLFEETQEWAKNSNSMARLLNAEVALECAMHALGRCYWREGFPEFSLAASTLRQLVDHSGTFDYQRRVEVMCLSHPQKEPMPVAPFNEFSAELMLPPILKGDLSGGPLLNTWVDRPTTTASMEERSTIQQQAIRMEETKPLLEIAAKAVVKGFGYHVDDSAAGGGRTRIVPFTAFFVSPKYLLTTRTAKYSTDYDTYASKFTISTRLHAVHGMLTPGEDLVEVKEVSDQHDFLVSSIRRLGVNLEDSKVPSSFQANAWNDVLLLEVADPKHYSFRSYLLPELNSDAAMRDEEVFALQYSARPTDKWHDTVFGDRGHVGKAGTFTEDLLRTMCWSYDTKLCAVGKVVEQLDRGEGDPILKHSCTLMPGSRGCPILRQVYIPTAGKHGNVDVYGQELLPLTTFAAISTGRSSQLFNKECDNIVQMSTGDLARSESLAANMYNEAMPANHVCMVLLYQHYIAPSITDVNHRAHLHKFLHPWSIIKDAALLSKCHRAMLLDADDCNEYGMDFYDHQDLNAAQQCFREGAKMFSTASIPNLGDQELELRAALQTNVSAVVVAKLKMNGPR